LFRMVLVMDRVCWDLVPYTIVYEYKGVNVREEFAAFLFIVV
jgi:hypothetical protein